MTLWGECVQQHDVFGFDVPVDDVQGVEIQKGLCDLGEYGPGVLFRVPFFL